MVKMIKNFIALLLSIFLTACTITHFEKQVDGSYKASNYSVGMDRKDLKINTPNLQLELGESNSSETTEKIRQGLTELLEIVK